MVLTVSKISKKVLWKLKNVCCKCIVMLDNLNPILGVPILECSGHKAQCRH